MFMYLSVVFFILKNTTEIYRRFQFSNLVSHSYRGYRTGLNDMRQLAVSLGDTARCGGQEAAPGHHLLKVTHQQISIINITKLSEGFSGCIFEDS